MLKRIVAICVFVCMVFLHIAPLQASITYAADFSVSTDIRVGLQALYVKKSSLTIENTQIGLGYCVDGTYRIEETLTGQNGFVVTPDTQYYYQSKELYATKKLAKQAAEKVKKTGATAMLVTISRNMWSVYACGAESKDKAEQLIKKYGTSKNTPIEHMQAFYHDFDVLKNQKFDGMIITGAPVEQMPFEDVNYWEEISDVFNWAHTHVTSTLYICWAAQAGLYHFYGVPKYPLNKKMFGIFKHGINVQGLPIFRGFDDEFFVPHSRHTEIRREDILKVKELTLLAESEDAGVYMVMARNGREFFITGHSEYAPNTLDGEYKRDLSKGLPIDVPKNYYRNDNPDDGVLVRWRGHANLLFSNWLNYYVYQETPFDINQIK